MSVVRLPSRCLRRTDGNPAVPMSVVAKHEAKQRTGGTVAILRIVNRGLDWETYVTIAAMLDIDRQYPLGLIMHGAGEVEGTVQVAQIWDSEEYARRFDDELLKPVLEAVDAPPDAEIIVFELEHLVTP
jgi:hypothetical protein